MPVHKNMPRPVYLQWGSHESSKANKQGVPEDPFTSAIEFMGMLNHVGTHVDAFYHLKRDGQTIDEMPIEMFMGKAVCFDLHAHPRPRRHRGQGHGGGRGEGGREGEWPHRAAEHGPASATLPPRLGHALQCWPHGRRHPLAGGPQVAAAWRGGPFDGPAGFQRSSPTTASAGTAASPTWSGCAIWSSWSAKVNFISRRCRSS